ncbi:MAG: carbon-nitrogen hydrolase family protein [Gammaproteobacteria bacterium]|nr:carbon-nitrogen hydrolase family protein [Gammaproteobacteria bacterium]
MTSFAVAALQLEAPNGDNTDLVTAEIDAVVARFPWIDMVLCPELGACGTDKACAEPMPGLREQHYQEVAKRNGIWLLPGSFFESDGDRIYNTAPVISPTGDVIARHRKLFPYFPYENGVTPGDQHTVFDIPGVARFGVSICYDMWFPETVRALAWQGAEIILHPTLTSSIDRDAELAMSRAHATQNQVYFLDLNVAGRMGVGESIFVGPGGEILHQAGKTREIIPLKINIDYLHEVRRQGWNNLCQPLKSFRDSDVRFPQYEQGHDSDALRQLGELRMPARREGGT